LLLGSALTEDVVWCADHACRYRKKIEKDEDYIKTVVQLGAAVEGLVKQNNALDIYEEYFAGIDVQHSSEAPSACTLTVLKDPTTSSSGVHRPVSCINWLQDGGSKVVVSYSILGFQQQPAGGQPSLVSPPAAVAGHRSPMG
jgi:dynein intermediate chain 2